MRYLLALLIFLIPQQGSVVSIPVQNQSLFLGYGMSSSETLTITPAQLQEYGPGYATDAVYNLNFTVQNQYPAYPGYWKVEVDYGTQELCSQDGWAMAAKTTINITCLSPHYLVIYKQCTDTPFNCFVPAQGDQPFVLKFTVPGWAIAFSNVSFTYTSGVNQ